jgi:hypothetical protein
VAAVNSNIDKSAKLKSYKFKKIDAEGFRSVPKERGPVEVSIKTSLRGREEEEGATRLMVSEVEITVVGLPAPNVAKSEPIFRIHVEVQGVYEMGTDVSTETLKDTAFSQQCASPLYSLAVGEIDILTSKLGLPRIRVPLVLSEESLGPPVPDSHELKPARKATKKSTSRKKESL